MVKQDLRIHPEIKGSFFRRNEDVQWKFSSLVFIISPSVVVNDVQIKFGVICLRRRTTRWWFFFCGHHHNGYVVLGMISLPCGHCSTLAKYDRYMIKHTSVGRELRLFFFFFFSAWDRLLLRWGTAESTDSCLECNGHVITSGVGYDNGTFLKNYSMPIFPMGFLSSVSVYGFIFNLKKNNKLLLQSSPAFTFSIHHLQCDVRNE